MKKIILIILILVIGYQIWHARASCIIHGSSKSYIVVYGRDACGLTREFKSGLSRSGVSYVFKNIDEQSVQDELYPRMRNAGLDTSSFGLPVIDVNGRILIRPELQNVLQLYGKPLKQCALPQSNRSCSVNTSSSKTAVPKTSPPGTSPLEISGIVMGDPPMAIVGGEVVKVGDNIGNYKVQEIQRDSVKFRDTQGEVIIKKISQD
jgi:hypothetical protein